MDNMDNMNMNNCPAATMDDSKASSSRRDDGGVITTTTTNNNNRNDTNNLEEDGTDTDSIAATNSVATGIAVAASSIASTGGYSGDCSSSEESCPTSSRSPDKIGLVIDITQKLCDGTSNHNINRKRKHHSKDKDSSSTSSNGSAANRRGKHDDRKRRRRTHDISRRYGNSNTDSSGNGSSNMRLQRVRRRRRSLNHKGHRHDFHSHLSTANASNDILLQPSLQHSQPSPIHPDIDPSITKLVKNWHGGTPTATGYDAAAAAAATAAFGTDQLSSHDEWQTMKKGKELLQKQQQCVSDSLCTISDVLQTYLEAVENNPSSSSEMATAAGTNALIGAGNSSDDGSASRKTTSTGAISTDHRRRHNRHHDKSKTKLNKRKQLPIATTSTTTRPHALPPSSTDSCTNKYYVKPSSHHLKDTSKDGHQHYRHPNLISDVVTYSDQSVSLEDALDLTNSPRLLLEASPPHRVIHANAAFSKLIILEDEKAKKNNKKKRSTKEKCDRTNVATTSTATCDWIQKQNTPPPSFSAASPAVTSSSAATSLLAAAAAAAWKNRSLQDAIEQMIPERVSVSGTTGGPHGIQQNHRYVFTCYPVCVPSFSGTYAETDSSSSSESSSSSSSSKKATSSSSAVAADAATVTGSDDAVQSNKDRKVHHVRGDNGIGMNGRQSHVSHYLIEGSIYDASSSSFDKKAFCSKKSGCTASSKLASHSRAVG